MKSINTVGELKSLLNQYPDNMEIRLDSMESGDGNYELFKPTCGVHQVSAGIDADWFSIRPPDNIRLISNE